MTTRPDRLTAHPAVSGKCPACGWSTLFLGSGGYVTCGAAECPAPDAADRLLHHEAAEHRHLEHPAQLYAPPLALRVLRQFGNGVRQAAETAEDRAVLADLERSAEWERGQVTS